MNLQDDVAILAPWWATMSAWKLQLGTIAVVVASLLEVAGIGALIVGTLSAAMWWLDVRNDPSHGEPPILAVIGLSLLPLGVVAFLAGFLARRWLTPRLHRELPRDGEDSS